MAGGVKISLIPDVSQLLARTDDVSSAFSGVADSLDDMAQEAQRAARATDKALDSGVTDSAQDSSREVDKLGKSFEDMARDASTATRKVGDGLDRDMADGAHKASESVGEFKDEARSNFSEVASSFSGGINGAADLVQGTLGGLAGSLAGPAGLAAGVLAGIGGAWFASMQANAEKQKALIEGLTQDMIDSGHKVASEQFIDTALQAIATGADDAAVSLKDLQAAHALTGISSADLARAWVGDVDEINSATATIGPQIDEAWDHAHNGPVTERSYWVQVAESLEGVRDKLTGVQDATDTAASRQKLYQDAVRAGQDSITAGGDQAKARLDAVGAALDALAGKKVSVDVDLTAANRTIANWRPQVAVNGTFRDGRAVN